MNAKGVIVFVCVCVDPTNNSTKGGRSAVALRYQGKNYPGTVKTKPNLVLKKQSRAVSKTLVL